MAMPSEHVTITSRDGLELSALVMPPAPPVTGAGVREPRTGARDLSAETPGVAVLHGFGSRKENHLDFAEQVSSAGMWAIVPDLRGHGDTGGPMDEGMIGDVLACLDHLGSRGAGPLGLRGSSMGGFLSLIAAPMHPRAGAVVAICPARPEPLAQRLEAEWPAGYSLERAAWRDDGIARGFWHATGDEVVPWSATYVLYSGAAHPKHVRIRSGGHHRSLQHDPRVQAETTAFLTEHLTGEPR